MRYLPPHAAALVLDVLAHNSTRIRQCIGRRMRMS
jgi:hypothetical protein